MGSALKVKTGTPDYAKLERTRLTEAQLINASISQIDIKTRKREQLNRLSDTVNKLLKGKEPEHIDIGHLYETLLNRTII